VAELMKGYPLRLDGTTADVVPVHRPGGFDLEIDGRRIAARLEPLGDGEWRLSADGRSRVVWIAQRGNRAFVQLDGRVEIVNALEELIREAQRAGGDALLAPMPGTVIRVATEVGRTVAEGEALIVIESMKLQTSIFAPHEGRVAEIPFGEGQSFDKGAVLVRLEPVAAEETPS
jgi:biotin carboxyl carrier protein